MTAGPTAVAPRVLPLPSTTTRPQRTRSARLDEIVAAARQVVEAEGLDALTMRRLADEVGMRAPSLYKHLPDKQAVELALVEEALFEVGDATHAAVRRPGRRTPLAALMAAYRRIGTEHPAMYRLATSGTLPRSELLEGLEDWAGEPYYLVTGDEHLAQALWSFGHGMVILEIDERFLPGSDLDRTWRAGLEAFASRLEQQP